MQAPALSMQAPALSMQVGSPLPERKGAATRSASASSIASGAEPHASASSIASGAEPHADEQHADEEQAVADQYATILRMMRDIEAGQADSSETLSRLAQGQAACTEQLASMREQHDAQRAEEASLLDALYDWATRLPGIPSRLLSCITKWRGTAGGGIEEHGEEEELLGGHAADMAGL